MHIYRERQTDRQTERRVLFRTINVRPEQTYTYIPNSQHPQRVNFNKHVLKLTESSRSTHKYVIVIDIQTHYSNNLIIICKLLLRYCSGASVRLYKQHFPGDILLL